MKLFESYSLNDKLKLNNRIVMAPMTRCRAIDNIPNELLAKYYNQRAEAGLIITEGTSPSPNGLGYPRIPAAYSDDQILGWKKVAEAVHEKDGNIFIQLMHCGRIVGKSSLPEGAITLAPSAVQATGEIFTEQGMAAHDTPKEMSLEEISKSQEEFVTSSRRLVEEAGIDGIELHAANGYLLNQFINPKSNIRKDQYGGNVENRARYVLETAQKVADAIGAEKVGIRFSPYGAYNDMEAHHDEVVEMFSYLAEELSKMGIAYIHIVDQRVAFGGPEFITDIKSTIKEHFKGTVISGGDVNSTEKANKILDSGLDLVYVGRPFISNPNLVEKLKNNKELVTPNPDTFFSASAEGFTDY